MTKIKRYFKLDAVGVCMTIYSIIIVAVTTVNQSQLIGKSRSFFLFCVDYPVLVIETCLRELRI